MIWSLRSKSYKIFEKIFQDRMWPFFYPKIRNFAFWLPICHLRVFLASLVL